MVSVEVAIMAKALVEDKDAFYAWLAKQPLIVAAQNKIDGKEPSLSEKPEMSEEDRAFAEAMKGMA